MLPKVNKGRPFRQLLVPVQYRDQVIEVAHGTTMSGHLGAKKTSDRVLVNFYWPGILDEMPLIDTSFRRIAVDIVGPIHPITDSGNRYILTIVDYATRYPEAVPHPKIETERVAEALLNVFSRIGEPQ